MVTGMVMVMGTVTAMDTAMGTGTIRMTRRWSAGRRFGRSFLRHPKEGGKSGTRDAGHGTENRDAGQVDLRFTIYDLRLQAGLILNHLTLNTFFLKT